MSNRMQEIRTRLAEISALEDPTEAHVAEQGELIGEYDRLEELDRVRAAALDPGNREEPRDSEAAPRHRASRMSYRGRPWEFDPNPHVTPPAELASRAMDLIESHNRSEDLSHDRAEAATQRVQADQLGAVARHILMTGTPEYEASFRAYLRDPELYHYRALSLSAGSGGYLLPYILDPSLVAVNAGSANPFRRICRVEQTTSNAWQGVNTPGVTGAWLGEGVASSDNSPTVGQIQVTPQKASAWVFGSYEVLQDTNFSDQLPTLFTDMKDRMELAAFATGTGAPTPNGVVTLLGTGTATNFTSTISTTGLYGLWEGLAPRWRTGNARPAVLGNLVKLDLMRQQPAFSGAVTSIVQNNQLMVGESGVDMFECSAMTTGTAAGSQVLVAGDWNQAIIVDRIGTSMIYEPLVKSTGQFPTGQAGWYLYWRVGLGLSTTGTGDGPFRIMKL